MPWGHGVTSAKTILVVGLSDARRAANAALLTQAGYGVVEFVTAGDALAHVVAEAPPLVILDHELSDVAAGIDLCRSIKQASDDTFIIQISHNVADDPRTETEAETFIDAYLVDPVEPRELLALVRSLLRLQKVEADLRDSEDRLLLAQESAGLAILDWVIATNTFIHSDNLVDLFDLDPAAIGDTLSPTHLLERIHPDDLGALIAEFSTGGQAARNFDKEFRVIRRDGDIRWIASRGRFFSNSGGSPERMVSLSYDITERKNAERTNAELASIVASSLDAIVSMDLSGRVTTWNAGAIRLFGVPAAEMLGEMLGTAFADMPLEERAIHLARLTDGDAHEFETRQTLRDGTSVDLWITSAPMRAADGPMIGASLIMRDVSDHKKREEHVRFLMRELTHRSKNLLAVIQAMARQSVTRDILPEEFVKRFTSRLAGLAGSHDLLSSVDWKGASLMDLIRSQLNHYAELFDSRILLQGTDIFIKPAAAQNIGIALHELSTNAAKYGALSNETGIVTVDWTFDTAADPLMTLTWRESGGPAVVEPTRQGFGRVVMDRIAGRALGGKSAITFAPDGVVWVMDVPSSGVLSV